MKIIWILNHYATNMFFNKGGRHHFFAKYLKEAGYDVRIFCASSRHNGEENLIKDGRLYYSDESEGIDYTFVRARDYKGNGKERVLNMIDYYRYVKKVAKHFPKPDVIIGSSVHPLACVAAINLSQKLKCKNIVEIRDLWPESLVAYGLLKKENILAKLLYQGEKWIYKKADRLIFTMEGYYDYIRGKGWEREIERSKCFHINNGVDLDEYNKNILEYKFEDNELDSDCFKIVYTGALREGNNSLWVLLKAAKVLEYNKFIKILIYGEGTEKAKFINYCKENSIKNVYIKGNVDKKFIPYILSKSDLNILNCSSWSVMEYGGSQNKLFEYLASGKPTISGEDSKYSIITNNGCGVSKNIQGPEELCNIILGIMTLNTSEKQTMKDNIQRTSKTYDYKKNTESLIDIIEF